MPVIIFWIINIIQPFLQLAMLTNLHWWQTFTHLFQCINKCRIFFQNFCCLYSGAEYIKHNLVGHGCTCIKRRTLVCFWCIFRRHIRIDHQPLFLLDVLLNNQHKKWLPLLIPDKQMQGNFYLHYINNVPKDAGSSIHLLHSILPRWRHQ